MSKAIKTVYRNGHIQLPPEIHLPEDAQVTVIVPDHSSAEGANHSAGAVADSAADIRREDLPRILEDDPVRETESEFARQKCLFLAIPESEREQYRGQYVASRDGRILDSDEDLRALSHRFFSQHGEVSVYMTKIDGPIRATLRTPLLP
jgi:DNA-directed RNA polymerase subunit H (RpoH/RPB5)